MELDVRTLYVALMVATLWSAIMVGAANLGNQAAPGVWRWVLAYLMLTASWGLVALRGHASNWLTVLTPNLLIFSACALIHSAIVVVLGSYCRLQLTWSITLAGSLAFILCFPFVEFWALICINSFTVGCILLNVSTVLLQGAKRSAAPARCTLGLWLGMGGVMMMVRLVNGVLNRPTDLMPNGWPQVLILLIALTIVLGSVFGFALMSREEMLLELNRRATFDALTCAYNRHAFDPVGQAALARLAREGGAVSVLMLDLDHFKQINDSYGHATGDVVLQTVTTRFQDHLRAGDVLARYGGEEFCVLLPATPLHDALDVAERLRLAIAGQPVVAQQRQLIVTVSIGVASTATNGVFSDLIARADSGLYAAKAAGRNCVHVETTFS